MLLVSSFILQPSAWLHAATTIDAVHRYGWGANIGWMDWRGDTNNGAVIGPAFCSGSLYAADVGWISLGSRAPTNGVQYQNLAANDYGVNVDDLGNLRGYAWGANIGWIAFAASGAPAVDFASGRLSGCAWGANVGWISLSNSVAYVQTTPLTPANDLCAGAVALTNGMAALVRDGLRRDVIAGRNNIRREDSAGAAQAELTPAGQRPASLHLVTLANEINLYQAQAVLAKP